MQNILKTNVRDVIFILYVTSFLTETRCYELKIFPLVIGPADVSCMKGVAANKEKLIYRGWADFTPMNSLQKTSGDGMVLLQISTMAEDDKMYSSYRNICAIALSPGCKKLIAVRQNVSENCYCTGMSHMRYTFVFNVLARQAYSKQKATITWLSKANYMLDVSHLPFLPGIYIPDDDIKRDSLMVNGKPYDLSNCVLDILTFTKFTFVFCVGGPSSEYSIVVEFIGEIFASTDKRRCHKLHFVLRWETEVTPFFIEYTKEEGCTFRKNYTCIMRDKHHKREIARYGYMTVAIGIMIFMTGLTMNCLTKRHHKIRLLEKETDASPNLRSIISPSSSRYGTPTVEFKGDVTVLGPAPETTCAS